MTLIGADPSNGWITILVRIEASDGTLLFINDTNFMAIDAEGPKQDLVVPVVAVEG